MDHKAEAVLPLERNTTPTVSFGAEVPQELFEHILWYALRDTHIYAVPLAGKRSLEGWTSMALVSTYFARLCRPWIYHHVALRSQHHLEVLIDLLDFGHSRAGAPLLAYTKYITITSSAVERGFWVHHFPTILIPKMQSLGIRDIPLVHLGVEAQLPGLGPDRYQAHWQLPRSIPSSLFRCVYALDLALMQFKRGDDLLRFLSMLPNVSMVKLNDVTCMTAPDPTVRNHRPLSSRLRMISGSPSGPPDITFATILPAVFAGCSANFASLLSHPSECAAILELLQLPEKEAKSDSEWGWWTISRDSHSFTLRTWHGLWPSITLYPVSEENTPTHGDLRYDCSMYMAGVHATDPTSLAFWHNMADHIARLRFLNELDLEFDTVDIMADFVRAMRPVLRSMRAAGRRIFLSERETGVWYTAADALEKGVLPRPLKRTPKAKALHQPPTLAQDTERNATEP